MSKKDNPTPPPASEANDLQRYNSKRELTRKALESQPKKSVFIPKLPGQPPDYTVTINGVVFYIECGKEAEVPEQVAEMLKERLESEGLLQKRSEDSMKKMREAFAE